MHIGRRWLGELQTSFKFSPPGKDQSLVQLLQSRLRVGASNRKRVLEICLLKKWCSRPAGNQLNWIFNINILEFVYLKLWVVSVGHLKTQIVSHGWMDWCTLPSREIIICHKTIYNCWILCIVHCALCMQVLSQSWSFEELDGNPAIFVWQLCYQLKWWSTRWKSIIHKITRLQTVSKPSAQPEWQSCLCTKPSSKGNGNGNYVCACDCQFFER